MQSDGDSSDNSKGVGEEGAEGVQKKDKNKKKTK